MIFKKLKSKLCVNMIHFKALCKRYISLICADKFSLFTLILQAPIMVLVIKLACNPTNNFIYRKTTMFVVATICVIMATLNSYREVCKERDVLIREVNAGLDATAYILSKFVVQMFICFLQAIVIVVGTCFIMDLGTPDKIFYLRYFLFTFLTLLTATCMGLFISTVLKNSDSAILPVLFLIIGQVVFSGAFIELTGFMKYVSLIVVSRWALGGYSHIFNFKGLPGYIGKSSVVYDAPLITDVFALIVLCLLSLIFSIIAIQRLKKRRP